MRLVILGVAMMEQVDLSEPQGWRFKTSWTKNLKAAETYCTSVFLPYFQTLFQFFISHKLHRHC